MRNSDSTHTVSSFGENTDRKGQPSLRESHGKTGRNRIQSYSFNPFFKSRGKSSSEAPKSRSKKRLTSQEPENSENVDAIFRKYRSFRSKSDGSYSTSKSNDQSKHFSENSNEEEKQSPSKYKKSSPVEAWKKLRSHSDNSLDLDFLKISNRSADQPGNSTLVSCSLKRSFLRIIRKNLLGKKSEKIDSSEMANTKRPVKDSDRLDDTKNKPTENDRRYTSFLSVGKIGQSRSRSRGGSSDSDVQNGSESVWQDDHKTDQSRKEKLEQRLQENGRRILNSKNSKLKKYNGDLMDSTLTDDVFMENHKTRQQSHEISPSGTENNFQNGDLKLRQQISDEEILKRNGIDVGIDRNGDARGDTSEGNFEEESKWSKDKKRLKRSRLSLQRSQSENVLPLNGYNSNRKAAEGSDINVCVDKECKTEAEISADMDILQDKLRQCTDFSERRKIRGMIRKLREQKPAIEIKSEGDIIDSATVAYSPTDACAWLNGQEVDSSNKIRPGRRFSDISDISQLRQLLSDANDYDEKKQIRLALRQLRQREKERESGRDSGLVNGRAIIRSQSFATPTNSTKQNGEIVRESGDQPKVGRSISLQDGKSKDSLRNNKYTSSGNYVCKSENESSRKSNSEHSSGKSYKDLVIPSSEKNILDKKFSSSESVSTAKVDGQQLSANSSDVSVLDRKPPSVPGEQRRISKSDIYNHSSSSKSSHNFSPSLPKSHPLLSSKSTGDLFHQNNKTYSNSVVTPSGRSHSVVAANIGKTISNDKEDNTHKQWLEGKKRSSSVPNIDREKLLSTLDMEAAFSELLSAVDETGDRLSDNEPISDDIISEDTGEIAETNVSSIQEVTECSPASDKPQEKSESEDTTKDPPQKKENEGDTDSGVVCVSPTKDVRPKLSFTPTPSEKKSAISIIEDEDGLVTVQSVSHQDQGDHTITEKTTLRRTESKTEEEMKDTVIESKVTSPGGSDTYIKDVIKTRRKITSRGSDYFSRSTYNIRKKRNLDGNEIEERDLSLETDNFSVTKGESWGDRTEGNIKVHRAANQFPSSIPEGQESRSVDNPTSESDTKPPSAAVHSKMDVSKTSSGYGSVSGSDEDDKEEHLQMIAHGRPSDYWRCSAHGSSFDYDDDLDDTLCIRPLEMAPDPSAGWKICCPEIKSPLKDVITLEGSTGVLECTVTCNPLPTVAWFKGKKSLVSSPQYEPKFDSLTGKASLVILNTSTTNGGEYKCVFRNPMGEAETIARLTVRCRASRKPTFSGSLKDITVTEGQSVSLECKAIDATQIAWYKDGIIQRNSSDFKQTFDGSVAKLEIEEIFLDDQGEYSCIAKNDKGEAKTSCKIKVRECDAGEGDVVPMFLTRPESKIYSHDDTIILECDVIGSPQPKITWCRDGANLCSDSKLKMFYDGRVALLKISHAKLEDSGKYEVFAENSSGKVKVDALIVVKDKQGPPIILCSLTDETAMCGKALVLQCDIRGSPVPVILWRKDGRMIGNTSDFKQTYTNNIAKLEIKDLFKQDGGCYECVARNSFGAVSSSCTITVQGENSSKSVNKRTDWLVGRDIGNDQSDSSGQRQSGYKSSKDAGIKRSESVRVTSTFSMQDRFRQDRKTKEDDVKGNQTSSDKSEVTNIKNVQSGDTFTKTAEDKDSRAATSVGSRRTLDDQSAKTTRENPPWKNVTLRRTESARAPSYSRTKPLSWKRGEEMEKEKTVEKVESEKEKPSGWRSVTLKNDPVSPKTEVNPNIPKTQISLRRSESARVGSSNQSIVAKFLQCAQQREKLEKEGPNTEKLHSVREISRLKVEENPSSSTSSNSTSASTEESKEQKDTKLGRSQSMRLLFEKNSAAQEQKVPEKKELPAPSFLGKRDLGLRRTSSLKMLPGEREAGSYRAKKSEAGVFLDLAPLKGDGSGDSVTNKRKVWENGPANSNMPSYDTIDDEEELHKILSNTDNFEERKKIRARMREIRERKQKESEQRRLQREKETEDIIRKRHEQADIEKQRKLKEFDKMAKEATADRERILQKSEDLLRDKLRIADEDKKRHLEVFDKLAQKDERKTVTVTKTPGGGTRTTVITESKTSSPGFGGTSYGKPTAEQAAKFLTNQLINQVPSGTSGQITIKTESWDSRDGVTNRSEKTEAWGAKPAGVQGAKAMFKQMDSSSPSSAPNGLLSVSYAKKAATTLRRNAAAIKQDILNFCQSNTREYEGVEVTNFSSCWNNGMAFCALIHHFYPEAFDFSTLDPKKRRYNFTLAFDTAEKYGDIAPLLDVEDMVRMQKPDWKCVFTYVQSLYRKLHTHELNRA